MQLQQQVGLRLRALREQRGLSQEALAAACALHRTYIGLIERGERSLSIPTIEVIASALGVSPAQLFEQTDIDPIPASPKGRRETPTLGKLASHVATIRQVLIEAKLIDQKGYEERLKKQEGK
ncbi:MAG TPA: helix-turn-helix transcriptional regulator [Bryobacteraceae bacterium]|jgi:transcriptional regulator with XRE-family HTH domain|nr:helix-turn-helix transcriptional regulator [Bryobacteraceae bacterium]